MADASKDNEPCWCTQMPTLPPSAYVTDKGNAEANRCYCRACLLAIIADQEAAQRGNN
jgi:hypothetical protein